MTFIIKKKESEIIKQLLTILVEICTPLWLHSVIYYPGNNFFYAFRQPFATKTCYHIIMT
ncbi:hypothetical protein GCM10008934_16010 [Virgibacillus salarius]